MGTLIRPVSAIDVNVARVRCESGVYAYGVSYIVWFVDGSRGHYADGQILELPSGSRVAAADLAAMTWALARISPPYRRCKVRLRAASPVRNGISVVSDGKSIRSKLKSEQAAAFNKLVAKFSDIDVVEADCGSSEFHLAVQRASEAKSGLVGEADAAEVDAMLEDMEQAEQLDVPEPVEVDLSSLGKIEVPEEEPDQPEVDEQDEPNGSGGHDVVSESKADDKVIVDQVDSDEWDEAIW